MCTCMRAHLRVHTHMHVRTRGEIVWVGLPSITEIELTSFCGHVIMCGGGGGGGDTESCERCVEENDSR